MKEYAYLLSDGTIAMVRTSVQAHALYCLETEDGGADVNTHNAPTLPDAMAWLMQNEIAPSAVGGQSCSLHFDRAGCIVTHDGTRAIIAIVTRLTDGTYDAIAFIGG